MSEVFVCVVDNRHFLSGLDSLYRDVMKIAEATDLLQCARTVCDELHLTIDDTIPVEGYYTENAELTEYFLRMRALQAVDRSRSAEVQTTSALERLHAVTASPCFGEVVWGTTLLPQGLDSLGRALDAVQMTAWALPRLVEEAYKAAFESDNFAFATLACLAKDATMITAIRETTTLYSLVIAGGVAPTLVYEWTVEPAVAERAALFIEAFNTLMGASLPAPIAENAEIYYAHADVHKLVGRCVRLGHTNDQPERYYHWAINYQLEVEDFWADEIWTTERYSKEKLRIMPDVSYFE